MRACGVVLSHGEQGQTNLSLIFGSILGSMCLMRFSLFCFLMEEERLERNASSVVLTRSVQGHVVGDTGIVIATSRKPTAPVPRGTYVGQVLCAQTPTDNYVARMHQPLHLWHWRGIYFFKMKLKLLKNKKGKETCQGWFAKQGPLPR